MRNLDLEVAITSVTTDVKDGTFVVGYTVSKAGKATGTGAATFALGTSQETVQAAIAESICQQVQPVVLPSMSVGDTFAV